jgi:hypothetical protein
VDSRKFKSMSDWLEKEVGTVAAAQDLINAFHWFLAVEQVGEKWQVRSGERVIYTGDSREHVEAFLYGMAVAYRGMSPRLYGKLFRMMAGTETETPAIELEINEGED